MVNKGTGAGGKNTNATGLSFEKKTSIEPLLHALRFRTKKFKCLESEDQTILYAYKNNLKKIFKQKFDIELTREPDEAFLIKNGNSWILKILEKKNQNGSGSVYDKLYNGVALREEYAWCIGETREIKVEYAYCISDWMKNTYNNNSKRNRFLRQYHERNDIKVFYGDDNDYMQRLHKWVFID